MKEPIILLAFVLLTCGMTVAGGKAVQSGDWISKPPVERNFRAKKRSLPEFFPTRIPQVAREAGALVNSQMNSLIACSSVSSFGRTYAHSRSSYTITCNKGRKKYVIEKRGLGYKVRRKWY